MKVEKITKGIDLEIFKAIERSIENNSLNSFKVLIFFIRDVLRLSIDNNSIPHFSKYIFFPSFIYKSSYEKAKQDIALARMHREITVSSAMHLKEIIWLDLSFHAKRFTTVDSKKGFNAFYYWAFYGFNRLFYFLVENKDFELFSKVLDQFELISSNTDSRHHRIKTERWRLQMDNIDGVNSDRIGELESQIEVEGQFDTYRRHCLLSVQYWIFFLHQVNVYNEEEVLKFSNRLKVPYTEAGETLQDVLFFRSNNSFNYFDWFSWDYMERPQGKAYSPPSHEDWLTFGFIVDQIRNNRLYVNPNELNAKQLKIAGFLLSDITRYKEYLIANYDNWKTILDVTSIKELNERIDNILSFFVALKRKSNSERERAIVNAPISPLKVDEFKNQVGRAWKKQARIHQLFKFKGTSELISNDGIRLSRFGRRTFFEKAKMMFIEGVNYEHIYGIEQMGGEIGRWEDNAFFDKVFSSPESKRISADNLIELIEHSISLLSEKHVVIDAIILSAHYSYNDVLVKNDNFVVKSYDQQQEILTYQIGSYLNIPVYASNSNLLDNKVVVCDFKRSFKLRYKADPTWFDDELNVNVHEISEDEAKRKYEENPNKWRETEDGILLSEDAALILIRTSVLIDIWTIVDFNVIDTESYVVGLITPSNV